MDKGIKGTFAHLALGKTNRQKKLFVNYQTEDYIKLHTVAFTWTESWKWAGGRRETAFAKKKKKYRGKKV